MKTERLAACSLVLLATVMLFTGFAAPVAHAGPQSNDLFSDRPVSVTAPDLPIQRTDFPGVDPAGYWTEEKMRSAIPASRHAADLNENYSAQLVEKPGRAEGGYALSHPVDPQVSPERQIENAVVPATVGKVFYSYKGKDYVCSGSVVNGRTKNLVSTAAHCVHGGKGEGWHSNIVFAPQYHNGESSYGLWNWKTAHTFKGWINSTDFYRDQAFFTTHPRHGRSLVATVGGYGMMRSGARQAGVRIWGWPAEKPYTGQVPYYCDGNTKKTHFFSRDMVMTCDMTPGASGGPWLKSCNGEKHSYVFGVTSRTTRSRDKLFSTPFNDAVVNLFEGIK